ncbi:MAG TPA: carbon storage regulator [Pirellulales bacterium]|nr:carbon storage regulator [Pirellulales bacterium]
MLVLTRKTQQQIQFGDDIVVTILQVRGQSVRVGIEAPRGVRVVRGEIASKPARAKPPLSLEPDVAECQISKTDDGATVARAMPTLEPTAHAPGVPGAVAENFSSRSSPQPRGLGKSRGLFPLLRERAQSHAAVRSREHVAPEILRSMASRI